MPRNGSGAYSRAVSAYVYNTIISQTDVNAEMDDIATALTASIAKDGQTTPTANLPMGGFKLTGLAAGSAAGNSLRYEQLFTTSAVQLLGAMDWVKGANIASATTINLTTATGNAVHVTGTTQIDAVTLGSGMWRMVIFDGILTLAHHATNNNLPGGANITTAANDRALYWSDGTTVYCAAYTPAAGLQTKDAELTAIAGLVSAANKVPMFSGIGTATLLDFLDEDNMSSDSATAVPSQQSVKAYFDTFNVPVRQTVLTGPVDSAGLPSFGGATGSATVTASGTLKATASTGASNYTGSITNPSWTGLSTDGTMYLFLDITSAGVVTTGSTTLVPVYQWGGTYSTTNLQNTFNIQEMTMKAGNGSTAAQVYRVFAGEVTVAGNVVTAITWYALMGRYVSADTATLPASGIAVSKNHNIGVQPTQTELWFRNTTTDAGYVAGDVLRNPSSQPPSGFHPQSVFSTYKTVGFTSTNHSTPWVTQEKTTGAMTQLTLANWSYFLTASRGW